MKHLLSNRFSWNRENISLIESILIRLREYRSAEDGAFYTSSNKDKKTVYSTIECLYPYLIYPFRHEYFNIIDEGVRYIIKNTANEKGVPDYNTHNAFPTVDATSYGINVFALARNFYLERDKNSSLLLSIESTLKRWISFVHDNMNEIGWGIIKDQKSRINSTNLVLAAISNCNDSLFENVSIKQNLIEHGIDYLVSEQISNCSHNNNDKCDHNCEKGAWYCQNENDENIANPHITATCLYSLNSCLRIMPSKKLEKSINFGANYLKRLNLSDIDSSFEENIFIKSNAGRSQSIYKFIYHHPYYMVLPALLMTGHMAYNEEKILYLSNKIYNEISELKLFPKDFGYWNISDIANALVLYFSVTNVTRYSDLIFSSSGFCPDCEKINRYEWHQLIKFIYNNIKLFLSKSITPLLKTKRWKAILSIGWIVFIFEIVFTLRLYFPEFFNVNHDIHLYGTIASIFSVITIPIVMLWKY